MLLILLVGASGFEPPPPTMSVAPEEAIGKDDELPGTENSLLAEKRLQKLASFQLIGGETIKNQMMRALMVAAENEEPRLKAEWRRTAGFIEYHPLLKKRGKLQATEHQIRKWREELATRYITDKED
jgi:hypothetical protein